MKRRKEEHYGYRGKRPGPAHYLVPVIALAVMLSIVLTVLR